MSALQETNEIVNIMGISCTHDTQKEMPMVSISKEDKSGSHNVYQSYHKA